MTTEDDPRLEEVHPERRSAWRALAKGATYKEAAAIAEVSTGSLSAWVKGWRATYGDDLFRTEASEARAAQTSAARQKAEVVWTELRTEEARNAGITGSQIRARLLALLPSVGTSSVDRGEDGTATPTIVRGPSGKDVKDLADAYEKLIKSAELLDDRPTHHHRRSVPQDQFLLGNANPALTPDGEEQSRALVLNLMDKIREKASGE